MNKLTLIQKFSITSLVAMILFGYAFGTLLGNSMEKHMIMGTVHETADIIHQNVVKHFNEDELLAPLTGKEYIAFTEEIQHLSLGQNIEKIEIWNSDLNVTWSSNPDAVGHNVHASNDLKRAFKGQIVHEITSVEDVEDLFDSSHGNKNSHFNHETALQGDDKTHHPTEATNHGDKDNHHASESIQHGDKDSHISSENPHENKSGRYLELYAPMRFDGSSEIRVVFEVYKNIDQLYMNIERHKSLIWLWTGAGFASLYVVFFGIVWGASRRLDKQTEDIKQSRQDWEGTFDTITDMITIHDKDFNIIRSNKAAEEALGLSLSENVTNKCFKYFHGVDVPPAGCSGTSCVKAGKPSAIEIYEHHLNKYIEIRAIPRFDDENQLIGLIHVVRDISEWKRHEREQNAIVTISNAMRNAPARSEMIKIVLDQIVKLMDVDGAALISTPSSNGVTIVEKGSGTWESWTGGALPLGEKIGCDLATIGKPYLNNEVGTFHADQDKTDKLAAIACVPLIVHEQKIGIITVGRDRYINEVEMRLLATVADIVANAIHRITLHEKTEKRMKRMAALHSIDMAISSSLDLSVILNVFLDQVTSQLEVHAASVLLLNQESQIIEYAAGRGFRTQNIKNVHLRTGEGLAGRAAMTRKIIKIPDIEKFEDMIARRKFLAEEGIVSYYACPLISKGQVMGVLEIFNRTLLDPDSEWFDYLETLSVQAAIAIDNAHLFDNLQRSNIDLRQAYDSTLEGWSRALDMRDKVTEGHTRRVTDMTVKIARAMGISEAELVHIRRGAMLHDIGKMGIPDNILSKPGKLTDEEWVIMRQHPDYAYEMLAPIKFLRSALDIPYCHHEMWDGSGYPRKLKGELIPLAARIFSVVDVWDALRSDRPYRKGWPEAKVREHMNSLSGSHFDPEVIEAFLELSEKMEKAAS